jgi:hypothetical protein
MTKLRGPDLAETFVFPRLVCITNACHAREACRLAASGCPRSKRPTCNLSTFTTCATPGTRCRKWAELYLVYHSPISVNTHYLQRSI